MSFIRLETERLIIRDHIVSDLDTHHQLFSNSKIMYYLQDLKTHTIDESMKNLLLAIEEISNNNRTKYFLRIEKKDTLEHIGEIGYTVTKFTPMGKMVGLGYFANTDFWGNGYASEAVKEILRFAFMDDNVFRISAGCITENISSEKVMKKCNMIKEAEYKMCVWHDEKLKDRVEYRLLRDEWMSNLKK